MATQVDGAPLTPDTSATSAVEVAVGERSRTRMVRLVRRARPVAISTLAVQVFVLAAAWAFQLAPTSAPVALLTVLLLAGLVATILLAALAVAAAVQRLALGDEVLDDEAEARVGWRAPVSVALFVGVGVLALLTVPKGLPTMRNGQMGYLDSPQMGAPAFVALGERAYAELVLDQLRFIAMFATVFAAWVAMSLTRHHPGWDDAPAA